MFIWITLLLLTVALYFIVQAVILPKIFFKNSYFPHVVRDRGISTKNHYGENVVVYEPDLAMREHVSQYMLIKNGNGKFLMCKTRDDLEYLEYDVVVYGKKNRILTVINVREKIKRPGYTEMLKLPNETSYVSLLITEVDKKVYENKIFAPIKGKSIALFSLCSAVAVFIVAYVVKICTAFIFGGIYRESILLTDWEYFITGGVSILISAINAIIALLCIIGRNNRLNKEEKR